MQPGSEHVKTAAVFEELIGSSVSNAGDDKTGLLGLSTEALVEGTGELLSREFDAGSEPD